MKFSMSIVWTMLLAVTFFSCKKTLVEDVAPPPKPGEDANLMSETYPPVQTAFSVTVNNNIAGYYEALPALYQYTTKNYPLLITIHDVNAMGDGGADLPKILSKAIPKLLSQKKFPASFQVGGKAYSFIVLSPQFKVKPSSKEVNSLIDYAVKHYRIDTSRIYMVGHSSGGGISWDYSAEYGSRVAAVVPISGANNYVNDAQGARVAKFNLPIWAFHNENDPTVPVKTTIDFVAFINSHIPNPLTLKTIFATSGHDAWTQATDPALKIDGKNIYEWMLQYAR